MPTLRIRAPHLGVLGLMATGLLLSGFGAGSGAHALEVIQGSPGPGFLIYGNYCGPGNRGPQYSPIDALDRACARHDACWPRDPAVLPACSCNARLNREAELVARSRRTPQKTRETARFIAVFAAAIPCDDAAGPRLPVMQ